MCSTLESALAEHRSHLNGLSLHCKELEKNQERLIEDHARFSASHCSLLREHRQLVQEHQALRDETEAVRDCLCSANLVSNRALRASLSRRRAPRVLKVVMEEHGLALALGAAMGVEAARRVCETSRGLAAGMRRCLPQLSQRLPPEIYVFGGKNDSSPALATAECFSPHRNEWRTLPPMKTQRYGCAAAAVNGMLYVVGGHDGQTALASAERFDPAVGRWTTLPNMPTARTRCAAVGMRGLLHVIGGRDGRSSTAAPATERFDPSTGIWEALPPMPHAPLGCAASVLSGVLYAVGVGADREMVVATFDP
ncbi:unnamed protein product, partial [Polarella glacialis]